MSNTPNLKGQAIETLLEMAPAVSWVDKNDAVLKLNISKMTVYRYLKGQVKDIDTATKLIAFLRKRIAEREKVIAV